MRPKMGKMVRTDCFKSNDSLDIENLILIAENRSSILGLNDDIASHLQEGTEFTFRVTVLQASNISPEYADIFCQFK